MPRDPLRESGARWKRVRQQVLAAASVCWLCGSDVCPTCGKVGVDSVDHIIPLSHTRDLPRDEQRRLALDPANLRPAHGCCNSARGAARVPRLTAVPRNPTSRMW